MSWRGVALCIVLVKVKSTVLLLLEHKSFTGSSVNYCPDDKLSSRNIDSNFSEKN